MEELENDSGDWAGNNPADPRESFSMLYKQYLPRVFRYISYKVGNISIAEDLTSNVFEKALVSFSRYRSEKASFSTWLFSIAHHTLADYFKVTRKRDKIPLEYIENTRIEANPEDAVSRQEELQRLYGYLSQLSQQEQDIIFYKIRRGTDQPSDSQWRTGYSRRSLQSSICTFKAGTGIPGFHHRVAIRSNWLEVFAKMGCHIRDSALCPGYCF